MNSSTEYIDITPEIRQRLEILKAISGQGASAFVSQAQHLPHGLTGLKIDLWIKGTVQSARKDYLEFVLDNWSQMVRFVPVTQEWIEEARSHKERTGLGPKRILATAESVPKDLSPQRLHCWMAGRVKSAPEEYLEFVLRAYKAVP